MRIVHWLFVVSVALFVTGIGFIIAGARSARQAPPRAAVAEATPIASVKQIMKGITGPAANTIFDAITTDVTAAGIVETAPQTEAEWEALGNSAAALVESGNLILIGNRAADQDDWVKYTRQMIESGTAAMKATQAKSTKGVLSAGEVINASCDACHKQYRRS